MDAIYASRMLNLAIMLFGGLCLCRLCCLAYCLLGVSWVIVGFVKEELQAWKGIQGDKKIELIPLATFWVMWKEKQEAFEALNLTLIDLKILGSKP